MPAQVLPTAAAATATATATAAAAAVARAQYVLTFIYECACEYMYWPFSPYIYPALKRLTVFSAVP